MPCRAVRVLCAASASSSASTSRFNRSAASSRAMFFSVLILAADRPSRPRRWARALRIGSGSNGSNAAVRRPQIAVALAVESCCPVTIAARPAKPRSRCRSAGMPVSSKIGLSRTSCLTRAWTASSRSDWLRRWTVITEFYRLTRSSCTRLTRAPILYRKRLLYGGLPDKPGNDGCLEDHATRFPICAKPEWLPSSWPCLFGAAEFRPRAPDWRKISAADRKYRRDQMPAGVRGGDLRGPRLARNILGNAGAAAIGAFCALSGGDRRLGRPGPDLSKLREPRGDRPSGRATRSQCALAARSRRGAALS